MNFLFYDFETFYASDYTLRKMSGAEYILDPRFEALGCGFKRPKEEGFWVDGPDLPEFFSTVDWSDTYAIAHNALFDACILKWRFNVNPAMLGDTIAMARNWWWYETGSASLAELSRYCGIPPKMTTLARTYGKRFHEIRDDVELYAELRAYGPDDAVKCEHFFTTMIAEGFPRGQLPVIDRQIRMCTTPQFVVDQELLAEYHAEVLAEKAALLARLGMDIADPEQKSALMSNDRLALLLMAHGITSPPRKISKTTGKEGWAFAKTDEDFEDLLEHENPTVQAIVAARLGVKSTIEETRTARFIAIGNLSWPAWERPQAMPVALKYSGTHTHRFSGDWKLNQQNLTNESKLRKGMKAPRGYKVVSADASQIEARILAGFAWQRASERSRNFSDLVQQFALKDNDFYANFASKVFGFHVNRVDFPQERNVGKVGILSLGYGASWPVFQNMVRVKLDGYELADHVSMATVQIYRDTFVEIPDLWRDADDQIICMAQSPDDHWWQWGPVWLSKEVMVLPNGNQIHYRNLRHEMDPEQNRYRWWYDYGNRKKILYGAKLVENAVQALAFNQIVDAAMRIDTLTKGLVPLAHQVHDELIYVVRDKHAPAVLELAKAEIARKPSWMPWLPLAASGGIGDSYGTAKGQ